MKPRYRFIPAPIVAFLAVAIGLTATAGTAATGQAGDRALRITLLSTTDLHAALTTADVDRATVKPYGGAAVVAAYIEKYRATNPGGTLVLDAGDAMQGAMTSNLFYGKPVIEIMNAVGYDAMAIGNHEFDWGVARLRERVADARFPFLSANIFEKTSGKRPAWAEPYTILERHGLRVGVIGATTVEAPYVVLPEHIKDFAFRAPAPIINDLARELRANGAALVILLAHEGGSMTADGAIAGPIADLAKAVTGVDAVIGGHSHASLAGKVNGIPVVSAYYRGRSLGWIELHYNPDAKRVIRSDQRCIKALAGEVAPDPIVAAIVDKYETAVAPLKNEAIGRVKVDLRRNYEGESSLGNLIADIMRAAAGTDFAFTNAGGIRADLEAGEITVGQIYEVMPFDNTLVTMVLTGAQVKEVLEAGATLFKGMVQLSGLEFAYDPRQPAGNRVTRMTFPEGTPIDPHKTYTVVTNDFMAAGGDNFAVFASGSEVVDTRRLLRDEIIAWLRAETAAGRVVDASIEGRITVQSLGAGRL
ncbi:MAG: bifunctional metallophosphatase/5'-nucleotidase [Bacteroidota bacterium]